MTKMSFNLLDAVILIVVVMAIGRGATSGIVRQVFSLGGFIAGLLIGALIAPSAGKLVADAGTRGIIIVLVVLTVAAAVSGVGEVIGHYLAKLLERFHIGPIDYILGAAFGGITALIAVWLLAGMVTGSPYRGLNQLVSGSVVVRQLDLHLPPAPTLISRLARLVDPNGFPRVFTGLEPIPTGPIVPATAVEVASAVKADEASTVKIQGEGCGGLVSGSGFVAAPGIVMTNAHVVAGIRNPVILDANGQHNATIIEFDPNMDVAVLRATGLAGAPLPLASKGVANGTHAVVLGYPGGGPFAAASAGVIDEREATGRNIYNEGLTDRQIYELQALVQPGNSGGPLALPDGTVIGVVFARSETNDNMGYALTSSEVLSRLHQAQSSSGSVSSGGCAAG